MELKDTLLKAVSLVDDLAKISKELSARTSAVAEQEQSLTVREKALAEKAEAVRIRENNLLPAEQIIATAKENDRARTELAQQQREVGQKLSAIQDAEAQSIERIHKEQRALGNLQEMKKESIAYRTALAEERRVMREKLLKELTDKLARG